jgi:serine protease Do
MIRVLLAAVVAASLAVPASAQNKRDNKVRADRYNVTQKGFWIYNDLQQGIERAKRTGKPLLVVLRCIPCEACAQLDAQVVERDATVRKLLDKFVCVRIVYTNGLDLSLFQYDYDQSFAAFFLNADKTIYGRYGTRSHQRESKDDVHIAGFAKALRGALALHKQYPSVKKSLLAKHGGKPLFVAPEKSPLLRDRYGSKVNYEIKNVGRTCIHCHQVGEAQRHVFRSQGKPIPEKILFPYPHPKAIGLIMDPKQMATVKSVKSGSLAAEAGFKAGDEIASLEGQPLLSIADIQWVLHNTGETAKLNAVVKRNGKERNVVLSLPKGWRRLDDISWRAGSWSLRRMGTGGLRLEILPEADRKRLDIADGTMALRVQHVGQYGPHAAAKKAGFRKGDVLISFDGKTDLLRDSDLLAYAVNHHKAGDKVPVVVLRGRRKMTLSLPMQN